MAALAVLAACATADPAQDAASGVDAGIMPDADGVADAAAGGDASIVDAAPLDAPGPDAASPDAMPPDAMPPDACVPDWIGLVANGDFEMGESIWTTTTSDAALHVIRMWGAGYPWPPHGGSWAALFGGYNDAVQTMSQTFTVPADATAMRLRLYECYVTEETALVTEWDTFDIELQTTGGVLLETLEHASNLDASASCGWGFVEHNAATSHAGQTIKLHFDVANDVSNISSFGIDTVSLEVLACP